MVKIRRFSQKAKKEALKLSLAVVIIEVVMVGVFYFAVKYELFDYSEPKIIRIENVYAKTEDEKIERQGESVEKTTKGNFYTYNAEEAQTDGNPYRTATGKIVKEGYVANNCLSFGTKIEVEGQGVLEVQDRMNSRYGCNDFDVFKENPKDNFKRVLQYKILK